MTETKAGVDRWRRAINNLTDGNNPYGKKLLRARIHAANSVVRQLGDTLGPQVFCRNQENNWGVPKEHWKYDWKRQYYTCSTFCTAIQATLDFSQDVCEKKDNGLIDATRIKSERVKEIVLGDIAWHGVISKKAPMKVGVKCRVCGRSIWMDGGVGGDPQVDWPEWAMAYDPTHSMVFESAGSIHNGEVNWATAVTSTEAQDELAEASEVVFVDERGATVNVDLIRAVVLTVREHELFDRAGFDTRATFAEKHGMSLQDYFG